MKAAQNASMPMNACASVFLTTEIYSISRMPLALKGNKIWQLCHSLWVNATEVNCQNINQSSSMSNLGVQRPWKVSNCALLCFYMLCSNT